jgi:RecA/RadA recombinase
MPKIDLKKKGGVTDSPLRQRLKTTPLIKPIPKKSIEFVSSGSWMLNLALTNDIDLAYPVGRIINAVGDYSTGKTLLACELVNAVWYDYHIKQNKKVKIYYDEPEAAFDMDLARDFNMPLDSIIGLRERLPDWKSKKDDFHHSKLVEDFYLNIDRISKTEAKDNDLILYVLDSLDSVSDAREIKHIEKKGVGKQDYGGGKARVLSQMFRTCIQAVNQSNIMLYIVSQVRENFGVMFGPKYTRAGGKALDHYASVIYWLKEIDKITTSKGINQGIEVEVLIDKNKVGSRYNKLSFNILHGYGVDNFGSAVNFLWDSNGFERVGNYILWDGTKYYRNQLIEKAASDPKIGEKLKTMLQKHWDKIVEEAKINRKPKWST